MRSCANVTSNLPKGKAKLISQQTNKISQQQENWENRNGPDLVQAFPKKWWVESDFTDFNDDEIKGTFYQSELQKTDVKDDDL
jgi:hypothetical protein